MNNNTEPKTKITSKQTVFKSKYFKIDRAVIQRDGKTFTKDILSRTPTVIVLPVNAQSEIYLVSQYRDSMQKTLLETVAGHIEKGDTPLESAKKELKEEVGLTAKTWKQIGTFYVSANMNAIVHIFYATDLTEGIQNLDDDENIKVIKIPFKEALLRIETGEICVSSNVASLLFLDKCRRKGVKL